MHTSSLAKGRLQVRPRVSSPGEKALCLLSFAISSSRKCESGSEAALKDETGDSFMTNFIRLADKPGLREGQSTLHLSTSQKQPRGQEEGFCSDPRFSSALSAWGRLS